MIDELRVGMLKQLSELPPAGLLNAGGKFRAYLNENVADTCCDDKNKLEAEPERFYQHSFISPFWTVIVDDLVEDKLTF